MKMNFDAENGTVYFGFAISDSMFSGETVVWRTEMSVEQVREVIRDLGDELQVACNPSHQATISAMKERFGIEVKIPEKAPIVHLKGGDDLIVMQVRGLPRLTDRHEYTTEEINGASFSFARWSVRK